MAQFKSFVSETELDDRRKKRQQEWDKVRKPDDPLEAPEEEYDPKSLYERLKEQKDRKQAEYEEAHKLKNMIRGLDDDEVEFLDFVDRTKEEIEVQRWKEEVKEIQEFRKAVATLAEKSADQRLQELKKEANIQLSSSVIKKHQSSLLAGVVKRKSCDQKENSEKRLKTDVSEAKLETGKPIASTTNSQNADLSQISETANSSQMKQETFVNSKSSSTQNEDSKDETSHESVYSRVDVIPGLGMYSDSSDSENSSCSEVEQPEQYDLLGRRRRHNPDE